MSALTPNQKTDILDELVQNTGADREFALGLLQDHKWQLQDAYKLIENMCITSAQAAKNIQNQSQGVGRGMGVSVRQPGPRPQNFGQRGGGYISSDHPYTGVGRAVAPRPQVISTRVDYNTLPPQRQSMNPQFPVNPSMYGERFPESKASTVPRPVERIVPIQVERGTAVQLSRPPPTGPAGQQQQPRLMMESRTAQPQKPVPGSQMPVEKTREMSNPSSGQTTSTSTAEHTAKLKRGISNIMENASLVSEARSSVLHDIQEDSHDHMYLMTFSLPDLTIYSEDFRAFLEKELIETSTLVSLEQAGRLNWWAELRICQRLLPMATSGDGNCLLHAGSLAMWGIHDRELILRNALYATMTKGAYRDALYRRWRWQQTQANKESELVLSESEWKIEWENLLKLASPKPRCFPDTMKRNSCCDSPVTQGFNSTDPVVYESLEEFHVFVLAHVLQRPIIIVADTLLKDSSGEALAPIPFGGIYLPLECNAKTCHRSPLLLTYDAAHFSALVPMDQEGTPEEKQELPSAIPLVDPGFQLLPLHFYIDPGPKYDWNKPSNNKKTMELSSEDKLNLLQQYMEVEKLQIPQFDADNDSDKLSCGSYESDDSVGCVGNKEKKKDARVSQQMQSVAKQFGSIGKSMGKKLKKNLGSIGKVMKNTGDSDKGNSRRQSVGSGITQSTKVIATIATDMGRDRVWCARLSLTKSTMHQEMVKNYLHDAQLRFEKDRELKRRKNEELRSRVAVHPPSASSMACVTPGCQMFGTADTAYLCSKCFSQQKREVQEKDKQHGQFVYNTFPGRGRVNEDSIMKYGNSKFYTKVEDSEQESYPSVQGPRLAIETSVDRQQSRSVGDVSNTGFASQNAAGRTPSPDYDNVDYTPFKQPTGQSAVRQVPIHTAARSCQIVSQPVARPGQVGNQFVGKPGLAQSISAPRSGQLTRDKRTDICRSQGCEYFGSAESDYLCSRCYKAKRQSLLSQAKTHTKL